MKFAVDFDGWIFVEAKTYEEAQENFWNWVYDVQEHTRYNNSAIVLETPCFECAGVEEE